MKKFTVILIAILYTAVTSGFTVNVHYCMGKLATVKLQSHADHACNKCGKPGKSGNCCKDEFKYCKFEASHQAVKVIQSVAPEVMDLSLPVIIVPVPPVQVITTFSAYYHHAPPGISDIPLYIQHCTYLI